MDQPQQPVIQSSPEMPSSAPAGSAGKRIVVGIIALIVLGALVYGGLTWFRSRGVSPFGMTKEGAAVQAVVKDFYNNYLLQTQKENPLVSQWYRTAPQLSSDLVAILDRATGAPGGTGGFDPILCAQDVPTEVTIIPTEVQERSAEVKVTENFEGKPELKVILEKDETNAWKITQILCPEVTSPERKTARQEIKVYFGNSKLDSTTGSCTTSYPVTRAVTADENPLTVALVQLFTGPSSDESQAGFTSFFNQSTRDLLRGVRIQGTTAYLDLKDMRAQLSNASTSCGGQQFRSQVENTLQQFPGITNVVYAFEGKPADFYEWMQLACPKESNSCDEKPFQTNPPIAPNP